MNYKKLLLIMISVFSVVGLLTGSVAYYRTTYEGRLIASTGNAVFNVTGLSDDGVNKTIDLGSKLLPGDSGEFSITLDSTGSTVDMYATLKIDRKVLPDSLKFYSTPDHKSEIKTYYSFLEVSGTKSETITIYWFWNPFTNEEDDNKYIGKELSADISISAVQISEYAMMKNGYSSKVAFWNDNYRTYIRTITFGNDLSNLPSSCTEENLCWDISYSTSQKKKVYSYLVDSGLTVSETDSSTSTTTEKILYNLYVVSEAPIFAPAYCRNMFENFKKLIQINFNKNFNTSNVTTMTYMFNNCSSLTSLDFSNFNTSKVTNMSYMFMSCSSLTSLDLSSFNTASVTEMSWMFYNCSSLTSLDLSSFNTSKVTNMNNMFRNCSSLTSLDFSSFNTSNVTDMVGMFYNCSSLTSLDFSSFNTSNVRDMSIMFSQCKVLTSLDLSSFNTSNVTKMNSMFSQCEVLTSLDLSSFNTSNVTDMSWMFYYCSSLTSLDLSNFNTSKVTNMSYMFMSCSSLISLDLSSFNTSSVTNMSYMFYFCSKLITTINIMNANVTNYASMFSGAATDPSAHIIIGYTTDTETIATAMRDTCTDATAKARIELKKID